MCGPVIADCSVKPQPVIIMMNDWVIVQHQIPLIGSMCHDAVIIRASDWYIVRLKMC